MNYIKCEFINPRSCPERRRDLNFDEINFYMPGVIYYCAQLDRLGYTIRIFFLRINWNTTGFILDLNSKKKIK
jgi:hypothetical protein